MGPVLRALARGLGGSGDEEGPSTAWLLLSNQCSVEDNVVERQLSLVIVFLVGLTRRPRRGWHDDHVGNDSDSDTNNTLYYFIIIPYNTL